jgi:hypothetical protein
MALYSKHFLVGERTVDRGFDVTENRVLAQSPNSLIERPTRPAAAAPTERASLPLKKRVKTGLSCNCVRSQCLKLYCDCFANTTHCNADCEWKRLLLHSKFPQSINFLIGKCRSCLNTVDTQEARDRAIEDISKRKPTVSTNMTFKVSWILDSQEESECNRVDCCIVVWVQL